MDLEQFELWLRPGVLGFYRSCEVTVCGLLDHDGRAHNLFTILVFEDRELASGEPVFLTKKTAGCETEFASWGCNITFHWWRRLTYSVRFRRKTGRLPRRWVLWRRPL